MPRLEVSHHNQNQSQFKNVVRAPVLVPQLDQSELEHQQRSLLLNVVAAAKTVAPVPRQLKQVLELLGHMTEMKLGRLEQLFEWTTRRSEVDQVNNFFLVTLGALCDPDCFET